MEENRKSTDTLIKDVAKTRDHARELAENVLDRGREKWNELREKGEESLNDVREQGEALWDDTQKYIRKYPVKAIGLALLVGTVFGALISFRRKD